MLYEELVTHITHHLSVAFFPVLPYKNYTHLFLFSSIKVIKTKIQIKNLKQFLSIPKITEPMAYKVQTTGLVFVLVASLWAMASAQSSSCTNALINLSPCLNYIQGNSSTPSSSCCSQLASTVRSEPQCLCEALNGGGSSLGISINQTQALALPGACNVQTPPLSRCNAASPANSPAGTSDPSDTVPTGTGSKTVPTSDQGTSDGSSTKMSISLLFFTFLAAAYTSA